MGTVHVHEQDVTVAGAALLRVFHADDVQIVVGTAKHTVTNADCLNSGFMLG